MFHEVFLFYYALDNMQRSRPFWEREKKVVLNNARSKRIRSKPVCVVF